MRFIHAADFAMLHERPHVVYSGNTLGRHARETTPKGCLLVTVDERGGGGEVRMVEFRETLPRQPDHDEDALLNRTRLITKKPRREPCR